MKHDPLVGAVISLGIQWLNIYHKQLHDVRLVMLNMSANGGGSWLIHLQEVAGLRVSLVGGRSIVSALVS